MATCILHCEWAAQDIHEPGGPAAADSGRASDDRDTAAEDNNLVLQGVVVERKLFAVDPLWELPFPVENGVEASMVAVAAGIAAVVACSGVGRGAYWAIREEGQAVVVSSCQVVAVGPVSVMQMPCWKHSARVGYS